MADSLKTQILTRKGAAEDYLSTKRGLWDEYEDLFNGTPSDDLSVQQTSQVFDHKISTQILERSARVMSQLATGKIKAISKNDEGASQLMNLILDKYVIPNANSQFDFLTKLRMVDLYSNLYGNFFAMVDWDVRKGGYAGPDLFLLPIRDVFPQVGAVSLEDSDYVIVRSWRPLSYFKDLTKESGMKNIPGIINKLKEKTGDKQINDKTSQREKNDFPSGNAAKGKGYFEVLSMYEKDRWVDWVTAADMEMRDMKNPHDDGELPVVNKYSIPMIDDIMGMGDMERGKSMQYTVNSLWNLYLDACRVSIFPPTLINKGSIADASSIKWAMKAKWLMKGPLGDAAQVLNLTPQGTNTFNNAFQTATASLMNMFGTTDTATTKDTGQEFGKTPQALQMQAQRENSRDNVDRFYMEQFVTKVMKKFTNLLSKKMSGNIAIRMFEPEIEQLSIQYPEIEEMYDEKTGKLTIKKGKVGSLIYDYEIVSGSTFAADRKSQQDNLMNLLMTVKEGMQMSPTGGVTSPMIEAMKQEGKTVKLAELFTRIVSNSGIQDWDKIIVDTKDDPDAMVQQDNETFMKALQEAGGLGQVPAQPPDENGLPQPPQETPPDLQQAYENSAQTNQL